MENLTREYPFQIPSYFALILRAFSVIEGIALRVDPSYSIVSECFPYLSRRLLTDNSPRVRAALQQMLYGVRNPPSLQKPQTATGTVHWKVQAPETCELGNPRCLLWMQKKKRLDIGRLQRMATGFGNFTVGGLQTPQPRAGAAPVRRVLCVALSPSRPLHDAVSWMLRHGLSLQGQRPILDDTAKEALRTLFRPEGSFIQVCRFTSAARWPCSVVLLPGKLSSMLHALPTVQEVFVEESVAAVDAVGREVLSQVSTSVLGSVPAMATLSFFEALGPLRPFILPVPTPLEVLSR